MSYNDPIADMLTRIRNGQASGAKAVAIPHSRMKGEIARILKQEGYVADFAVEAAGAKKTLSVTLKYSGEKKPCITGLRRISSPGLRRYVSKDKSPRVLGGLGVAVVTTSRGIMTDREARRTGIGGEVLFHVW